MNEIHVEVPFTPERIRATAANLRKNHPEMHSVLRDMEDTATRLEGLRAVRASGRAA